MNEQATKRLLSENDRLQAEVSEMRRRSDEKEEMLREKVRLLLSIEKNPVGLR